MLYLAEESANAGGGVDDRMMAAAATAVRLVVKLVRVGLED